jgi:hypothetical protein
MPKTHSEPKALREATMRSKTLGFAVGAFTGSELTALCSSF